MITQAIYYHHNVVLWSNDVNLVTITPPIGNHFVDRAFLISMWQEEDQKVVYQALQRGNINLEDRTSN